MSDVTSEGTPGEPVSGGPRLRWSKRIVAMAAGLVIVSPKYSNVEMAMVTGLGDEAITGVTSGLGTMLVFRVRDVVGTVTYHLEGPDALSKTKAFEGAAARSTSAP